MSAESTESCLALLPTADDNKALRKNFIIFVSRFLASNMWFFKFTFDGVIQGHIKHKYSKEMATKSTVVSDVAIIFLCLILESFPAMKW